MRIHLPNAAALFVGLMLLGVDRAGHNDGAGF